MAHRASITHFFYKYIKTVIWRLSASGCLDKYIHVYTHNTTSIHIIRLAFGWQKGRYRPIPMQRRAPGKLRSKRLQTQQPSPNRRLEKWVKLWQGDSYETSPQNQNTLKSNLHLTPIHDRARFFCFGSVFLFKVHKSNDQTTCRTKGTGQGNMTRTDD